MVDGTRESEAARTGRTLKRTPKRKQIHGAKLALLVLGAVLLIGAGCGGGSNYDKGTLLSDIEERMEAVETPPALMTCLTAEYDSNLTDAEVEALHDSVPDFEHATKAELAHAPGAQHFKRVAAAAALNCASKMIRTGEMSKAEVLDYYRRFQEVS